MMHCKQYLTGLFLIVEFILKLCGGSQLYGIIQPNHEMPMGSGNMIQYIYFSDKLSWNDARTHCGLRSGDLATIHTPLMLNYIRDLAQANYGVDIFTVDYWTGLVETVNGGHTWVSDCSGLDSSFKYNFEGGWKTTENCFKIKRADHYGDRKSCSEAHGFMCQVITTSPCPMSIRMVGDELATYGNMSNCESECLARADCWGIFRLQAGTCSLIGIQGTGVGAIDMKGKFCFNVSRDYSTGLTPDNSNNDDTPNNTCVPPQVSTVSVPVWYMSSSVYATPTSSTPFLLSHTLSVCPNVTENVTIYQTEYMNVTQTIMTSYMITTSYAIHHTNLVTVTLTSIQVQNITFEAVEAIAEEYVANLTVDAKTTSSYTRSKTSAEDQRESAQFMGLIGVLFVAVPMSLIIILDCRKIVTDISRYDNVFKK